MGENIYKSLQKVSSHVIWKIETFIEEDTINMVHRTTMTQPFKVGTLGPHIVLPVAISCIIIYSGISLMVLNLFPFKGHFSLGKSQKSQSTKSGLLGAESPGCFDVSPKSSAHEMWCMSRHIVVMKLPITRCPQLLYSLSHFECDGQTVHMLTQWHLLPPLTSTVKSSLFTHVHSSSLSLAARLHGCHADHSHYINSGWTDIHIHIYIYIIY